jgi:hypothetical protein
MTYQNDPNRPRFSTNASRPRYPMTDERSYTGWIVGAVVAVAVVLGIVALTARNKNETVAATNRPVPVTTGAAVPAPTSGMGTSGAPVQAPAKPAPAR